MINDYVLSLLRTYKQKGILIDANILLLWLVGSVNRQRISQFNRTEKFEPRDYDLLVRFLGFFSKIITTPNILTEVNSLTSKIKEPERSECFAKLAEALSTEALIKLDEYYIESFILTRIDGFNRFGLTDYSILELAHNRYLVLTDDYRLAGHLQTFNIDVINFNNLRDFPLE